MFKFSVKTKLPIRITVGGMFVIATILTATLAIFLQYYFTKELAKEHTLSRYANASAIITQTISDLDRNASYTTDLFAEITEKHLDHSKDILPLAKTFARALRANSTLYSIYIGNDDDEFLQLINLEASSLVRNEIGASAVDRWVLITHTSHSNERIRRTAFMNDEFVTRELVEEASNYYPTQRAWYNRDATDWVYKTDPYLFHNLKLTGQTYSKAIPEHNVVLGVDIVLSAIALSISENIITQDERNQAEAYLFNGSGDIIASNQNIEPSVTIPESTPLVLSAQQKELMQSTRNLAISNQNDWAPIDFALAGQPKGFAIDLLNLVQQDTGLTFDYINGRTWAELVDSYKVGAIDILHSLQQYDPSLGIYSKPLFDMPFGLLTHHEQYSVTHLKQWGKGKKIGMLEGWSIIPELQKNYSELAIVTYTDRDLALQDLKSGKIDGVLDSSAILKQVLSNAFDSDYILHSTLEDVNSDFPSEFYLVMQPKDADVLSVINLAIDNISSEQRQALKLKWLESELGHSNAAFSTHVPYKALIDIANDSTKHDKLHVVPIEGEMFYFYVTVVGQSGVFEEYFSVVLSVDAITAVARERVIMSIFITVGVMTLLLPLAWVFGTPIVTPITQLQIETQKIKQRRYDEVKLIDTPIKEVWELSRSIHEMSHVIREYELAQKEFIESTIKVIAEAIDDKSPYTAGHCNRVPELGIMLSQALEQADSGPFKDFAFKNNDERREFRMAAWLHDCGKITTPEHIIDKGSKLETIYNRIHEIRMRFEVLWRDAEINTLKQLRGTLDLDQKQALIDQLAEQQRQLQLDFAFVAKANIGGEFMSDEDIERIKTLSTQTWTRYFDNRLGLSPFEELAMSNTASDYPCEESLLADKAEHIVPRTHGGEFDPKLNINIRVPEHQYNLGEIYNLSIRRGTLTDEDRYKINEHMISGIKMLERLPFPPELSRVPRYASTHHETLKGTGYPRKLTADQLSIPERILVISDIFEALTASDRPYKRAKPISVAVDIMYKMALDEHFDMALFQFFLTSGTYLKYAQRFLPSEQVDEVNISKYLNDT
ncbi:HD domain-containing phosphohydrolase [Vibrio ulleungensis]